MFLKRRLDVPEETPLPVALALLFYVGHLFCAGWVASSEVFAFAAMAMVGWCVWKRLLVPSFHILYIPLALYGLASTISALVAPRSIHSFGEAALWGKILLFPAALILLRNVSQFRATALRMVLVFGAMASSMGLAQYHSSVIHSREAVLKEDLFRMREAIDQYYADKGQYPSTLDALVSDGYLRKMPDDPFTKNSSSWQAVPAEPDPNNPTAEPGVYDVKSGSDGTALDGSKYSEW